jgi:hypothetical protein
VSFDASAVEIPETHGKNSLAACQTWRAIVANPLARWATLEPLITAGGIALGDAEDRIAIGAANDDPDYGEVMQLPRAIIGQFDDDSWERAATAGFSYTGGLVVTVELKVPTGQHAYGADYQDTRYKLEALAAELRSLPRTYPYLDITRAAVTRVNYDPGDGGFETTWGGEIAVAFEGGD